MYHDGLARRDLFTLVSEIQVLVGWENKGRQQIKNLSTKYRRNEKDGKYCGYSRCKNINLIRLLIMIVGGYIGLLNTDCTSQIHRGQVVF